MGGEELPAVGEDGATAVAAAMKVGWVLEGVAFKEPDACCGCC